MSEAYFLLSLIRITEKLQLEDLPATAESACTYILTGSGRIGPGSGAAGTMPKFLDPSRACNFHPPRSTA